MFRIVVKLHVSLYMYFITKCDKMLNFWISVSEIKKNLAFLSFVRILAPKFVLKQGQLEIKLEFKLVVLEYEDSLANIPNRNQTNSQIKPLISFVAFYGMLFIFIVLRDQIFNGIKKCTAICQMEWIILLFFWLTTLY